MDGFAAVLSQPSWETRTVGWFAAVLSQSSWKTRTVGWFATVLFQPSWETRTVGWVCGSIVSTIMGDKNLDGLKKVSKIS